MGSPVLERTVSSSPSDLSRSQMGVVRRHCQTMALATGSPVRRSHMTRVSRWLVMPMATMDRGCISDISSSSSVVSRQDSNRSFGSCSTHPGRGCICLISRLTVQSGAPVESISIAVVLVVPWSIERM